MSKRVSNRKGKSGRRYVPGRRTMKLNRLDGAVVLRGDGPVKFYKPSVNSQSIGDSPFWIHLLQWLFESGEDAQERRKILIDEFLRDLQDRANRLEAYKRADAELEEVEYEVTKEIRDALAKEKLAEILEELADTAEMENDDAEVSSDLHPSSAGDGDADNRSAELDGSADDGDPDEEQC